MDPQDTASTLSSEHTPVRMELPLPVGWLNPDALKVLGRLHSQGYEAYLVGGCVRDLLVGRYPKDFDVATSAHPQEIRALFGNCRLIGKRFRLAHVIFRNHVIEVATFRRDPTEVGQEEVEGDIELEDDEAALESGEIDPASERGRPQESRDLLIRSDNVFGNPREDAFRRDFSINSLYYDIRTHAVIDWTGGIADVERRVLRTIGAPARRFQEDPVRMIRAIKFSSSLGFDIDEAGWKALCDVAPDIQRAAIPRVQEEIYRILRGGFARRCFERLIECDMLKYLLPGLHEVEDAPPLPPDVNGAQGGPLLDYIGSVDYFDQQSQPLPGHLLLGALLIHPASRAVDPERELPRGLQFLERAEALTDDFASRLRLPRRDREGARLALTGFARLMYQGRKAGLARRSYFEDSLFLYGLHHLALGVEPTEVQYWLSRVEQLTPPLEQLVRVLERRFGRVRSGGPPPSREVRPAANNAAAAASEGPAGRRRRRRRRGRGGASRGGEGGSSQ